MQTQKHTFIKWTFSILLLAIASLSCVWVYNQKESVTELTGKNEIKSADEVNID